MTTDDDTLVLPTAFEEEDELLFTDDEPEDLDEDAEDDLDFADDFADDEDDAIDDDDDLSLDLDDDDDAPDAAV